MENMQSPVKQLNDPLGALRISEFRNLMIGRFLFIMGLRMMGTLVGWWIYELTNAPFAIGLIGLAEVIPAVSLALYAGHVIDKSEKRKLWRCDGRGRRDQRDPGRPRHGHCRFQGLPGREGAQHRRPHGPAGQDLPDQRLFDVNTFTETGRGRPASQYRSPDFNGS